MQSISSFEILNPRGLQMEDYYPVISQNFFLWKIYWVTKKCTQNVTPEILLLSGSAQITEVNKRFTDMIDGQNWDVFQSFMDLFDAPNTVWGSCIGSKSQTLGEKGTRFHENKSDFQIRSVRTCQTWACDTRRRWSLLSTFETSHTWISQRHISSVEPMKCRNKRSWTLDSLGTTMTKWDFGRWRGCILSATRVSNCQNVPYIKIKSSSNSAVFEKKV